mmetsp:Transcript_23519/g.76513  ORF Transcript_23519/g.76513 Transcript_23519/m.76513 type:complete len:222 (+) Transcript_23519:287-952(+)
MALRVQSLRRVQAPWRGSEGRAGRVAAPRSQPTRQVLCEPPNAVGIFFSSTTGHSEEIAYRIQEACSVEAEEPRDIGDVEDVEELKAYDGLIVGTPTWNTGEETNRSGTAWDDQLEAIRSLDLAGVPVAVFGCGDSSAYGEYFCDAIEELHSTFAATGARMVGAWPIQTGDPNHEYQYFEASKSCKDNVYLGLPLDFENEEDMNEPRIAEWTEQVEKEFAA